MITVCCVLVRGNVPFTTEYVHRLRSMVARHLPEQHRLVCLTDQPRELEAEGVEVREIETPVGVPGWWAKLNLFRPDLGLTGEGLYLDLDVLPVRSLVPIARFDHGGLALVPHAGTFEGRAGRRVIKLYNSSVMRFRFGAHSSLWTDCTPDVREKLWGDQDWIGAAKPFQPRMPLSWFPRLSEVKVTERGALVGWPADARVILCKKPKNHEAAQRWKWFEEMWR